MLRDHIRSVVVGLLLTAALLTLAVGAGAADETDAGEFEIEITDANTTLTEGDTLAVNATVTNTGETVDSQQIHLKNADGDIVDSVRQPALTLEPGESEHVTLQWETTNGDSHFDEFKIQSNDGHANSTIDVEPNAFFDVDIDGTNNPIAIGETLNLTATVENTGNATGYTGVWLDVDGDAKDIRVIQLEPGQTWQTDLYWETGDAEAGNWTLAANAAGTQAETNVTVEAVDDATDTDEDASEGPAETSNPTETSTPTRTAVPDTPNDSDGDGTGFGVGIALLALLGGSLLARSAGSN